jgi:mono/diheme cytochrome c family protein
MKRLVLARPAIVLVATVALMPWLTVAEDASAGMTLYNKKCSMCHGKDGVAKKMAEGSSNLNDAEWQKTTSVEAIAKTTAEGKGKMPKYQDKLTEDEIKAIAEYVLTLN